MKENSSEGEKKILRGESVLIFAVVINSFGVVLMLYSGFGISAISSVPFAFSKVLPQLSIGTWTYIFQGVLVLNLMILRKQFVPQYLFSFVVGFTFGKLLDVHEAWISIWPDSLAVTAGTTKAFLDHLEGLGIGTVLAAFTIGKVVGIMGDWLDQRFQFVSFLSEKKMIKSETLVQ